MKSLLISKTYFPPQVGGISYLMASLAEALGPEQVCCLTGARAIVGNTQENFEPRVYRRPSTFAGMNVLQSLSLAATIAEILVRDRPQVVQLATVFEGYLGLWLRKWLGLPFVLFAHGNEIMSVAREDWAKPRLALRQANRVLAVSRYTASLVEQIGVSSERIEIVHPGCDADRFRPLPCRGDLKEKLLGGRSRGPLLLTVANLVARKGHDMVIRAMPLLRQRIQGVTYLIVGDGPHRQELQRLVDDTGVRECVVFAGEARAADLPDIYALGDVFVMPNREQKDACDVEGFGLVFLEANACGKPVIGGRSGGVVDAVVDGRTGLLVDPTNLEEVSAAIEKLLTNHELARLMGEQGRSRVVADFSWPGVASRVQRILETVVEEGRTHR